MARIEPERGYVLVEMIEVDPVQMGKTKIIMPDSGKEEPQFARIIAVGSPQMHESGQELGGNYTDGDFCYFAKWQGLEFMQDGKKMKLVKQDQIFATVYLDEEEILSLDKK